MKIFKVWLDHLGGLCLPKRFHVPKMIVFTEAPSHAPEQQENLALALGFLSPG